MGENLQMVPAGSIVATSNIPKLDGKNYRSWAELVDIVLELRGLSDAKTNDEVDPRINLQAKLIILESMNESHRNQVRGCVTVKAILERLQLVYADKSAANIYRMLHQYYRYNKLPEDSMSEHIGKMDEMRGALADLGEKQSETLYQVTVIGSLPEEYSSIMETWEMTQTSMKTTPNLVALLLKKETYLKESGGSVQALLAAGPKAGSKPSQSFEEYKKKINCYKCGKLGHFARECTVKTAKDKVKLPADVDTQKSDVKEISYITRAEINFNVKTSKLCLKDKFVCDSGATAHMCCNLNWFDEIEMFDKPRECFVGDGKTIPIHGVGRIGLETFIDDKWMPCKLNNVLYIPSISANLISVGEAGNHGIVTTFDKDHCSMTLNGQQVATGTKFQDKLYLMRVRASKQRAPVALISRTNPTIEEYHRILGHASTDRIVALLDDLGIKHSGVRKIECEACPGGKGRHASHPIVGSRAESPGVLHADLSGIVNNTSINGFKYYLVCKDEYSEFVQVYFCKAKSEVPSLIAQALVDFEVLSGQRVVEFHSDNGSEFVNQVTKLLFQKERVKHWTSSPFCPQQNGRIEREMQSVTNMARVMLNASKLPKSLWVQSIESAVHIKNRLPTSRSKTTPFERLTNVKPHIDHLVEFGTTVQVLINDKYLTKWDCRTMEGFIVGFTRRRNTYQVYIPSKERVIQTCDVIFARHAEVANRQVNVQQNSNLGTIVAAHQIADGRGTEQNRDKGAGSEGDSDTSTGRMQSAYQNDLSTQTGTTSREHSFEHAGAVRGERSSSPLATRDQASGKGLITGVQLDEFFRQYVNMDDSNDLEEDHYSEIDHTYVNESAVVRPAVPPPPPPPPMSDPLASQVDTERETTTPMTTECQYVQGNEHYTNITLFVDASDERSIPKSYQLAITCVDSEHWLAAIKAELKAHEINETWSIVATPNSRRLTARWVFTIKRDEHGNIAQYKARLVIRGFEQRPGIDFYLTYAPVARLESIRALFAIGAARKMTILQFDISTAFLNGKIEEEVYVDAPTGVVVEEGQCLKLNRAIYGLRQAPRAWNSTFNETLILIGFQPTQSDLCVYKHKEKQLYLAIYVDDGLVIGDNEDECKKVITTLKEHFVLKQLSGQYFLGIEIKREKGIRLSQKRYIYDILKRFNMEDANGVTCPIVDVKSLAAFNDEEPITTAPYREAIGCLMYLACCTRPDIMFAVSFLSSFNQAPREVHWCAVKRVLKYVKLTAGLELCYDEGGDLDLAAFSDADWGNELSTRRSTSGLMILLGRGPIIFASRKQGAIAQSSTEAEYIAANECVKEMKWLIQLLDELEVKPKKSTLFIDNLSTIKQIENVDSKRRSKHIELKYHYVRQQHQNELFKLESVESENQIADYLTKPLNGPQLGKLLTMSNIRTRSGVTKGADSMAKLALLLLAMMAVVTLSEGKYLEQTDALILLETNYQVELGTNLMHLDIVFSDPCNVHQRDDWDSVYDLKKKSYNKLSELCRRAFQDISTALRTLVDCLPEDKLKLALSRTKRFDPVTLLIIGACYIVVSGALATYEYYSPNSNTNKIHALEEKDEAKDKAIASMRAELSASSLVRNSTAELVKRAEQRSENNLQALQQSANFNPTIAWESSLLAIKMHEQVKAIAELRVGCRAKRLSINGLKRIVKLKEFEDSTDEDTHLDRLQVIGNDTISLSIYINQVHRRAAVFEVVAVEHWANYTSRPVFVEYHGPKYVMFDADKNCIKGIDKPKQKSVYENCDLEDFRDPKLQDWKPVVGVNSDEEVKARTKPIVVRVADYNIIYCLYKNITIDEKEYFCPPRPFKLSRQIPFKLMNTTYKANVEHIQRRDQGDDIKAISVANITDVEYERESQMFIALKENQDRSVAAGTLAYDKDTLTIPTRILQWICGGAICTIASIITVLSCLRRLCSGQPTTTDGSTKEETHSEQININLTQAPEPSEHHGHRSRYSDSIDGESIYVARHERAHHERNLNQLARDYNIARITQGEGLIQPPLAERDVMTLLNTLAHNMRAPGVSPIMMNSGDPFQRIQGPLGQGGVLPPRPSRPPPALPNSKGFAGNSRTTQSIA